MHFSKDDLKVVLRDFGEVTYYFSFSLFVPIIIALIYSEDFSAYSAFIFSALIGLLIGFIFKKLFKTTSYAREPHAIACLGLIWVVLPIIGGLPFYLHGDLNFVDSYFESVSAITTTGLTMVENRMPNSLIFWRAFEGWIGGAGIVILALIGLMHYVGGAKLFEAEGSEIRLRPNIINSVKQIWWVYSIITAFGVVLLLLTGVGLFDSVTLSMSAISTTGVENYQAQLITLNSVWTETALAVIMMLGAFPFMVHYRFLKKELKAYFRDIQVRIILAIALIATILIAPQIAGLYKSDAIRYAAFHSVSAVTAGGFNASILTSWNSFTKLVLMILMFIGGAAGSTAGGIKIIRFWLMLKSFYWSIKAKTLPSSAYFSRKIAGKEVDDSEISSNLSYVLFYITFLILGILVLSLVETGYKFEDISFEVISAQGNAGITVGVTSQSLNVISKLMLCINMIVGRIEIIPVLAFVGFLLKIKR